MIKTIFFCACVQITLCFLPVSFWLSFLRCNTMEPTVLGSYLLQFCLPGLAALAVSAYTTYSSGTLLSSVLCPHTTYTTSSGRPARMAGAHWEGLFYALQVHIFFCLILCWLKLQLKLCTLYLGISKASIISGAEAMFADLGHFSKLSLRVNILFL